jgi:hypothetical protein
MTDTCPARARPHAPELDPTRHALDRGAQARPDRRRRALDRGRRPSRNRPWGGARASPRPTTLKASLVRLPFYFFCALGILHFGCQGKLAAYTGA